MADNIRVKNIYYMLSYAYQHLREEGLRSVGAEEFDNIHDLFAAILVRGIGIQVRRGLHREYVPSEEPLSTIRGKILISDSIKGRTMTGKKLICHYDEFTEDSLHNRILKCAMIVLLRCGLVKPENKKALARLLLFFKNVEEIPPGSIRWDALRFHRNNSAYVTLVNLCHLLLEGMLHCDEDGKLRLSMWLDDQKMHRLFEKFILSYFRIERPELNAGAGKIKWDLPEDGDKGYLPAMITDVMLEYGDRTLIIDTKWYSRTMQSHPVYGSLTFFSQNLYQIFAYVKNRIGASTGKVAGILLYAKTDECITPDDDFIIGGSPISLKTLDLGQDWSAVRERLDSLTEWLVPAGAPNVGV